jgi:ribosomal protein S6E (S10)
MNIPHKAGRSVAERWRLFAAAFGVVVLASMGIAASSMAATYGPYNIRPAHSDKCMDVRGGSDGNGAPVQQWECLGAGQTNQQWYFRDTGDGLTYYVTARHSNKCLDVTGGSTANGAPLQQWQCLGYAQSNQRWYLTRAPIGGTFNLRAAHSNNCADVTGGSTANGAPLQQWQCLGGSQTNQQWYVTSP